jgi:hypothetical protein
MVNYGTDPDGFLWDASHNIMLEPLFYIWPRKNYIVVNFQPGESCNNRFHYKNEICSLHKRIDAWSYCYYHILALSELKLKAKDKYHSP